MTARVRSNTGLTLVEVLIAIVVIAVAFVALTYSQLMNLRVTADSQRASQATQEANEFLEILTQRVLADYASYQACPGDSICAGSGIARDGYSVSFNVSRGSGYTLEGLVRLDIRVTGPAEAELHQYVSCMDVNPPPTVAHPGVCG